MTVREAFIQYDIDRLCSRNKALKTRKNYRSALNSFVKACADIPVELVTVQHIVQWKAYMAQNGHTSSTMAGNVSKMREVFKYLKRLGMNVLDYEFMERPEIIKKDPVWLDVDEVRRFLEVIDSPRDKAIFAMLFSSGARISELMQLDRDSIVNGEARIIGKGSKPGALHFDTHALRILEDYLETRRDKLRPMFISAQCRRMSISRVEQLAHVYADYAGIDKNVTPHVFRHSFATDLKMNGADIYDIKTQLRHSRLSSTDIYVHINDTQKREIYDKKHTLTPLY